ncbi:ABC transporter ATP-binding protein [Candidatus Oscillochloris fontis]|uniref:ABC transporter ATP-binding protein n=1 Tax=Candidatus Oscillochloris fontis TaxID=2496868 RepID=UPI00101CDAD5|nr:ABC transporter ATP-binding protein [Candidatus Oscillochloris fontis]
MIEASQLSKQFGAFQAVRSIDLNIQPGELLALLGPNGAGKTTTVRMLGAILKPSSGYARICGHDVVREAEVVRSKVGLLTEYPGLYGRMAAMEYLDFFGSLLGLEAQARQSRAELLLRQFGMWEARDRKLDGYSKGMKQKIALVRALIHDPPVLFLDEPTTAMDPQSARTVRDAIQDLRAADRSILLTTHNLSEAEVLADRIAIIRSGQIIAQGTIAELTRQLLGAPIYELRLAAPLPASAAASILADLITVESQSDTALRYRCSEPHLLNPQILSRLAATGLPVVSLAEVPQRLEEVYLRIVAD